MPKMRGSIFDFKLQCNKETMVITMKKILNIFDKNVRGSFRGQARMKKPPDKI